jgi:tetratricopeptide (TPR) repeat protein
MSEADIKSTPNSFLDKALDNKPSNSSVHNKATLLELSKLYMAKCDHDKAIENFEKLSQLSYLDRDFELYLECLNSLLRMYADRIEEEKINRTKERLQDLVLKDGFELTSKTYYTLGVCADFKGQNDLALEYFQKALALGLSKNNKKDMCYAIMGIAITYSELGKYSEALQEVYNLKVFFEVFPLPELKLSTQILNGVILSKMGRYDEALESLWSCYDILKTEKNHYYYLHLLYVLGVTYQRAKDLELARVYLQLAKRSIDSQNLKVLAKDIEARLVELGVQPEEDFDLVFDSLDKTIMEKKKGKVDFKNQFILLELLHLLMKSPGVVYSKELIVKTIWNQDYIPAIHDNKIYVTIKRLRKMIEPDYEKPKYVFRAKNGYYFNKNIKVRFQH